MGQFDRFVANPLGSAVTEARGRSPLSSEGSGSASPSSRPGTTVAPVKRPRAARVPRAAFCEGTKQAQKWLAEGKIDEEVLVITCGCLFLAPFGRTRAFLETVCPM